MKVRTLFSGIGAPESALKRLGIDYELVDFCEIDKYAVQSYCAVHNEPSSKNLGDISKVWGRDLPYADLLVWGFPCTDISVAGKQQGIVEGETRSGLYYEGLRILRETKPKYSIIENVKNLTGKKFKAEFEQMLSDIEEIGYNNYWQVLNAKNYGIPQNRERVFIVSIRKDIDTGYEFPKGFDNGLRLKDFLEDEVDEKYYISQEKTEKLISQLITNGFDFKGNTITVSNQATETATETALCLLARDYKGFGNQEMNAVVEPNVLRFERTEYGKSVRKEYELGIVEEKIGNMRIPVPRTDGIANTLTTVLKDNMLCVPCLTPDRVEKRQNGRRFKEDGEPMFTLTSQDRHGVLPGLSRCLKACTHDAGVVQDYRIRKLTPKECWRLMGFNDEEFQRAVGVGVSNSQLYKQAGNSIVVDVLCEIFKKLLR